MNKNLSAEQIHFGAILLVQQTVFDVVFANAAKAASPQLMVSLVLINLLTIAMLLRIFPRQ